MEKKFTRLIYHGFITCLFFLATTLQAQVTQVFTYTGNTQTFTVPAGVTSLQIKAWGAGGGGSNAFNDGGSGGSGAFITATLQVSAGEQYTVQVGGGGKSGPGIKAGGYAGGGSGGRQSGSGGGYSAIFLGNTIGTNTRVVAGGGGGAYKSINTYGGAGSGAHAANMSSTITGGKTPGPSGVYNGETRGATGGTLFQGGKGSTRYSIGIVDLDYGNGGGGGGGVTGGGGGVGSNGFSFNSTGGGGGSSYNHPTLATSVTLIPGNTGNTGDWVPAPANTDINYIAGVGRGGENQANGGNGLIVITYTEGECTGNPTGGSAVLTPNTGTVGSLFTANVTGGTIGALGLTYEWEMSVGSATGPWTAIPGATTASVQLTAPNEPPGTKIYYRRKITCTNSGMSSYSTEAEYTIYSPSYCDPESFINNDYYIKGVRFLGTLNDVQNLNNGFSNNPKGYQDWTGLGTYASQEQGGAINLEVENSRESHMAAWVDWNNDGTFQVAEQIYNTGGSLIGATMIGLSVPATQPIGYYRIRIRVSANQIANNPTTNCQDFTNGETEDYLFQVLKACDAKVTSFSVSERCGVGTLPITINTVNATSVKIYTAENANNPIASVNVNNNSATYTTASISETRVYYVAAANGTCEARHRVKIIAKVNPTPNIDFDNSAREFCGDASGNQTLQFAALGDKETVELVNENFNTNLGVFTATMAGQNVAPWTHRTSNFIPGSPSIVQPAIASGISGDGFAVSVTDVGVGSNRINHLTTTQTYNTTGFLNLHLDYSIYTFFEGISSVEKVNVEVSGDNGSNWNVVKTYSPATTGNVGIPNKFLEETIDLNAYIGAPALKVRFSIYALGASNQWSADIGAVDKVRLYGEKPLVAAYSWSVNNGDAILFNDDCITPYNGATNSICVKPSAALLELRPSWKIKATASLSNGCEASGEVDITNNNKTFQTTATGWAAGADWKPSGVPDATKCVIIKSPVTINSLTSNYQAFAKKVKIEAPGTLTVKSNATYASSLTVSEEFINNNTAENSVVLENNTSLKQLSGSTGINHGNITVHRNLNFTGGRNEYNYLSTPVTFASGQSYKTIYPGVTSANYPSVLYYVESTRYFLQSSGANILGRSSAVKEAGTLSGITNNRAEFKGVPYVGDFTYPLAYSSTGLGFNLVGNPYPSNVDLQVLYSHNSSQIEPDFRFWDNKANDNGGQQHGAGYNGRAYARYNALSDIGNEAGYYLDPTQTIGTKKPNKILKVGQGMMVQALGLGKSLSWNNAPNVKTVDNTSSVFFGKTSPDNRYWLTMKTPDNLVLTAAFTYIPELSNAFEKGDSKVTSGESDSFYSMTSDAEKVVINARSIFNPDDVVPLGTTHYAAGSYTISLGDHEGIFANGQNVYLKDKELNIVTNLSEGPYIFTSNSGQFTNRFEIVYLPQTTLDVTGVNKESVQIYRDGEDFVVKASTKNIKDVELYEMSGKLIFKKSAATREVRINATQLANGIYMVRAFLDNGEVTTKKVRY